MLSINCQDRVETKDEDRLLDFQIEHDLVNFVNLLAALSVVVVYYCYSLTQQRSRRLA
jgi:hypothetical protein